jgi:hypothetical protein
MLQKMAIGNQLKIGMMYLMRTFKKYHGGKERHGFFSFYASF